jgi:hypothetical protein
MIKNLKKKKDYHHKVYLIYNAEQYITLLSLEQNANNEEKIYRVIL